MVVEAARQVRFEPSVVVGNPNDCAKKQNGGQRRGCEDGLDLVEGMTLEDSRLWGEEKLMDGTER